MSKLQDMANNNIRLVAIYVPFASTCGGDALDSFNNFHADLLDGEFDKIFPALGKLIKQLESDGDEDMKDVAIAEHLVSMPSDLLIGKFSTPVVSFVGKHQSYSWGYTHEEYLIGYSIEELATQALAWQKKMQKQAKKKAA